MLVSSDLKGGRVKWTVPLLVLCALLVSVPRGGATGWAPNVREGSDIVMKDLRWPQWSPGTYFCFWYVSFYPGPYGTFYGGVRTSGAEKRPGMFMSYWGNITNIHEGEDFYRHGYGAEGSKGGANGEPGFLRPGGWYRMVLRVFPTTDAEAEQSYVGWWVKDVERDEWFTHSVVRIDTKATGVKGNSGFVEALAPDSVHREFEYRSGYCRVDGEWQRANEIESTGAEFFSVTEGGTVLHYERSKPDPKGKAKTAFVLEQPAVPDLGDAEIGDVTATAAGDDGVVVRWSIPKRATPQLGYRIEVFADAAGGGEAMAVLDEIAPQVSAKRVDLPRAAKSVRLTVRDVFDQTASVLVAVDAGETMVGVKPEKTRPGLSYSFYEAAEGVEWDALADIDWSGGAADKRGVVRGVDDTIREERDRNYGIAYRGYVRVPADGDYVIELGSSDGSQLKLGGRTIALNDGIHGTSVRQYPVALEAGLHAFELLYFKGAKAYLADKILLSWEGPGFEKREMAGGDFVCDEGGEVPSIRMPAGLGNELADNLVKLRPVIERRGQAVQKVQFFRGQQLLGVAEEGELEFDDLLPAGTNRVWVRLWYGEGNSVDSDVLELEAKNKTEGRWSFEMLGESHLPMAVRSDGGRISFRGDGFCFGQQPVSGDFSLTARVAEIALSDDENGIHRSNWMGLYVQDNLKGPFSGNRFGVYCTAGGAVKGSADYPDLAGTYVSIPSFPSGHRWLRIERRGVSFLTYTSADGEEWEKAAERIFPKMKADAYAGVVFRAVPGKSRSLFSGAFDHVRLDEGGGGEGEPAVVPAGALPGKGQVVALVQAEASPETLYARVSGAGMLKSVDRGESWTVMGGEVVRSVAVHPVNTDVVLRGTGRGLSRSVDGGGSWELVGAEIDFSTGGASMIFGEVISFCAENPDWVAAGGESGGLFVSRDGGVSWNHAGFAGERIACLGFVPETRDQRPKLVVGTFGNGEVAGSVYWIEFRDGKARTSKCFSRGDLGVTNVAFGAHENFYTIATTRGLFYTWQRGNMFSQRRDEVPADRFFTALGYRQFQKEVRKGDVRTKSNTYAVPSVDEAGRVEPVYSVAERTTGKWARLSSAGGRGVTCVLADGGEADVLWLCGREGILKSVDGGRSYRVVYGTP